MTDYDAALKAARDEAKSRMCEYTCPMCDPERNEEWSKRKEAEIDADFDAYEALAMAVAQTEIMDTVPCPAEHKDICVRADELKAEADRLAAPYLEEVKA